MYMKTLYRHLYKEIPDPSILTRNFQQFILPTEMVIYDLKQPILPRFARAYSKDFYFGLETKTIITREDFNNKYRGGAYIPSIKLLEYFEDYGDDGHTDYKLIGWVFVTKDELSPDIYTNKDNNFIYNLFYNKQLKK